MRECVRECVCAYPLAEGDALGIGADALEHNGVLLLDHHIPLHTVGQLQRHQPKLLCRGDAACYG